MEITATTPASVTTAKGTHTGTIQSCCAYQAEMQGSYATITVGDVEIDIDAIDFDGDEIDATIDLVVRAAAIAAADAAAA